MKTQELPQWTLFEDNAPSHGEYIVLLKQEGPYPEIAIAYYTYVNGGAWQMFDEGHTIIITSKVHAYMGPRLVDAYMVEGDEVNK